ncbi:MAG TPA: hypothetical protein VJ916_05670 [Anaerovoracaceae bacterium]|nr:hypothetical protein [Anaerovoracaceae bacterium]
MATIKNTEVGIISINNYAIEKLVIKNLLKKRNLIILTNKKGKPIVTKGIRLKPSDYVSAVEITEYEDKLFIKIYFIIEFGISINKETNKIFDMIERDFENIGLDKPTQITAKITGVKSKQTAKRELEVVRRNE